MAFLVLIIEVSKHIPFLELLRRQLTLYWMSQNSILEACLEAFVGNRTAFPYHSICASHVLDLVFSTRSWDSGQKKVVSYFQVFVILLFILQPLTSYDFWKKRMS